MLYLLEGDDVHTDDFIQLFVFLLYSDFSVTEKITYF